MNAQWCLIPLLLSSIELFHLLTYFTNKDNSFLSFSTLVWILVFHLPPRWAHGFPDLL